MVNNKYIINKDNEDGTMKEAIILSWDREITKKERKFLESMKSLNIKKYEYD